MEQYINKSAVIDEIKKRLSLLENGTGDSEVMKRVEGVIKGYKSILSFLDTLETKEVDLEKELDKYTADNFWALEGNNESLYLLEKDDILKVAKHFYELGLKAQKGD